MKKYYNQNNPYALRRHQAALDLGFRYVEHDLYLMPECWNQGQADLDIKIDLSATGELPNQILKTSAIQLLKILQDGISVERLFEQQL